MAVLPDRDDALRIAAFLDEHAGWSAFWDKRSGVWRVSEDDPGSELYAEDADASRVIDYMSATANDVRNGEDAMSAGTIAAGTVEETDPRIIAFILPGIPESVPVARFHVRAALAFHDLGQLADDAAVITSELVTNAVQHACCDATVTIGVTVARPRDSEAVIVAVSDSSTLAPVMQIAPPGSERGRGLQIVESLSAHWGWHPEPGGKAVFAILAGRQAHDGEVPQSAE
ncbi:MAG TPA: ATP-binding protein [Streptosporangiaceae bacterium]|nr:ATP-binding protein [Streptosporangiaceae bacterium]